MHTKIMLFAQQHFARIIQCDILIIGDIAYVFNERKLYKKIS